MIRKVKSITNIWIEWYEITIEADITKSLPNIDIVGLPDTAIKEAKERIRSTFKNCWIDMPARRIILNLSPSDIKKVWTRFDLPMAVAIYLLLNSPTQQFSDILDKSIFIGELGLDWSLKSTNWVLPCVISAKKIWYSYFFIPATNLKEVEFIEWIKIFPLNNFIEMIEIIAWIANLDFICWKQYVSQFLNNSDFSFADIKWHLFVKRALMVWVSWLHNILMVGPPWSWKTLLAKSLSSILPPMNFDEIIEVSQIYSLVWMLGQDRALMDYRPFRTVHNTASKISIIWGWANLIPWEVSLAHKWILFFDEILEFPTNVLESLRQPLEDKYINISRANWSAKYPCKFMFVWAMNPCKCWYYKDRDNVCGCSLNEIKKYQSRISGPLFDRFDMLLEVPRQNIDIILEKTTSTDLTKVLDIVKKSWSIQQRRFKDTSLNLNCDMWNKDIDKYVILDVKAEELFKNAIKILNLSPRLIHRILKLSRTIADLDESKIVLSNHISEALQYRSKNMFV